MLIQSLGQQLASGRVDGVRVRPGPGWAFGGYIILVHVLHGALHPITLNHPINNDGNNVNFFSPYLNSFRHSGPAHVNIIG